MPHFEINLTPADYESACNIADQKGDSIKSLITQIVQDFLQAERVRRLNLHSKPEPVSPDRLSLVEIGIKTMRAEHAVDLANFSATAQLVKTLEDAVAKLAAETTEHQNIIAILDGLLDSFGRRFRDAEKEIDKQRRVSSILEERISAIAASSTTPLQILNKVDTLNSRITATEMMLEKITEGFRSAMKGDAP